MKITWRDVFETRVSDDAIPKTQSPIQPSLPSASQRPVTPMKPIGVTKAPEQTPTISNPPAAPLPANPRPFVPVVSPKPSAPVSPVRPISSAPETNTTMNSDGLFLIGTTHDVCQDYVSHHNNGSKCYVVLADGCSGSRDSDTGARVLVKTHEHYIPKLGIMDFNEYARRAPEIYNQVLETAQEHSQALQLDPMALDATLLSIISNKDGDFMISCYGDGVVALGRHDGIVETYAVSYKEGYPNYPSYRLSEERTKKFSEKTGNVKEITIELSDGVNEPQIQKYTSSAPYEIYLGKKEKYRWVAILSDGVQSFTRKVTTPTAVVQEQVPMNEVLQELFAFKNFQGTFVRRRVNRFLELCKERDWTHEDDFSVGVVYLGDDN